MNNIKFRPEQNLNIDFKILIQRRMMNIELNHTIRVKTKLIGQKYNLVKHLVA